VNVKVLGGGSTDLLIEAARRCLRSRSRTSKAYPQSLTSCRPHGNCRHRFKALAQVFAAEWLHTASATRGKTIVRAMTFLNRGPFGESRAGPGWSLTGACRAVRRRDFPARSTPPGADGVIEFTPFEFLDRLADLIPQPRRHRRRYHGVFAPNHPLRSAFTALAVGNVGKRRDATTGGHADGRHAAEGCCNTQKSPSRTTPPGLRGPS